MFFIKETPIYTSIKKNIPNLIKSKIFVYFVDSLVCFLSSYSMVCVQKMIDAVSDINSINYEYFYYMLKLTVFIILSYVFFTYLGQFLSFFLNIKYEKNILSYLFGSFYRQTYTETKKCDSGEFASILMNDSLSVGGWIGTGMLGFLELFTNFAIRFVILWNYYPPIAITIIVIMSICFACTRKINCKIAYYNNLCYEARADLNQFFINAHKSYLEVKQLKKEDDFISKFKKIFQDKYIYYNKMSLYWEILYKAIFLFVLYLFPVGVLLLGIFMTLKGQFTIGKTIAVYTLINMTQSPLNALAETVSSYKQTMVLSERLDVFDVKESENKQNEILETFNSLKFDKVCFGYDDKKILDNLNFEVKKGDIYCIKGYTGKGKSTIASLIMRFYKAKDGQILINDLNINNYTPESYYSKVNILSQHPCIFQETLKYNILLDTDINKELYDEVVETAQLKDFLEKYGEEHILEEDANNISGGQKQRIGLARFLIRKPELLILDEPTSALDETTEENLAKALVEFAKKYNITLIIVSHSTVFDKYANQIFTL